MKRGIQILRIVIIVLSLVLFTSCKTKEVTQNKNLNDKGYDIYLLIGQSNMAGRGQIESQDKDTLRNVLLFRGDSLAVWEKAANPLNKYSTVRKELSMQKLGPGYTFAKTISAFYPERTIGLVVNARGGTSLREWSPSGQLFKEAVKRIKAATEFGIVRGVLWHQGESNVNYPQIYADSLEVLVQSLRKELKNPKLPFIAGQIFPSSDKAKEFNKYLLKIPKLIPYSAVVLSDSTTALKDNIHFDAVGQRLMGIRYAEQMYKLLNNRK